MNKTLLSVTKASASLVFALFVALVLLASPVLSDPPETVTICHASSSNSNPYIVQNPSADGDVSGHDGHNGGVYPADPWGDIIPPFDFDDDSYPGKNWTTEGQAIYNNECSIPNGSPTPTPTPTSTPTPTPTPTPFCDEEEEQCEPTPTPTPTPTDESTPTPTPTPEVLGDICANIDGIQTSVPDGLHLDASGRNCVAFELGGPGPSTDTSGQVLGASTLGATGLATDNAIALIFSLGASLLGIGIRKRYAHEA